MFIGLALVKLCVEYMFVLDISLIVVTMVLPVKWPYISSVAVQQTRLVYRTGGIVRRVPVEGMSTFLPSVVACMQTAHA